MAATTALGSEMPSAWTPGSLWWDNRLWRQTVLLNAHSALGSRFPSTPVALSAIANAIRGYTPVTLEKMTLSWSLLIPKLCFLLLVTYFYPSLTIRTYIFDIFLHFLLDTNANSCFSLAAFSVLIPQLNLLGRERTCICAPYNMALGSRMHPIWNFMTSGKKEVIKADEFWENCLYANILVEVCDSDVCGLNYEKSIAHLKIHYKEHKMNFKICYEIRTRETPNYFKAVWSTTQCIFSFYYYFEF